MNFKRTNISLLRAAALWAVAFVLAMISFALPANAYATAGTLTYGSGTVESFESYSSLMDRAKKVGGDVTIDLSEDWFTSGYLEIPKGRHYTINLHGHMINRGLVNSTSHGYWYGTGNGEVIMVRKNATLTIDGGTEQTSHPGRIDTSWSWIVYGSITEVNDFWIYDANGSDCISGGLITGGACDDWHGAGGISAESDDTTILLKNVTVAGNVADEYSNRYGNGAGVAMHGDDSSLTLDNAKIMYNHAEGLGGGVYFREENCTLTMKNGSEISNNYADEEGGGVFFDDSDEKLEMTDSAIKHNYTEEDGGGIYMDGSDSTITMNNSTVYENTASLGSQNTSSQGGGLYFNGSNGSVKLTNGSSFYHNCATDDGGAIYDYYNGTTYELDNSKIEYNESVQGDGGAIYFNDVTTLKLTNGSDISNNWVHNGNGGAIYVDDNDTKIYLTDSSMHNNVANYNAENSVGYGGAIYFTDHRDELHLENSSIYSNTSAVDGGAIYCYGRGSAADPTVWIYLEKNSTICKNNANASGGAYGEKKMNQLYVISEDKTGVISGNIANDNGGAFLLSSDSSGHEHFNGVTIRDNLAMYGDGGAIWAYNNSGYTEYVDVAITGNKARGAAGGIYSKAKVYVGGTVTVWDNQGKCTDGPIVDGRGTLTGGITSNLALVNDSVIRGLGKSTHDAYSTTTLTEPTKDCKIGVTAYNFTGTRKQVSYTNLGYYFKTEGYPGNLYSDDDDYVIAYEDAGDSMKAFFLTKEVEHHTVTLYSENLQNEIGSFVVATGETVTLNGKDYTKTIEYQGNAVELEPVNWSVYQGLDDEAVEVEDGAATFTMGSDDVELIANYPFVAEKISMQVDDSSAWDDMVTAEQNATVTGFAFLDGEGKTSYAETDEDGTVDGAEVVSVTVEDGKISSNSKTVTYVVNISAELAESLGYITNDTLAGHASKTMANSVAAGVAYDSESSVVVNDDGSLTITAKVVYSAAPDDRRVQVTINKKNINSGSNFGTVAVGVLVNEGTLEPLELAGYQFFDWQNLSSGATVDDDNVIHFASPTKATTVTARYVPELANLSVTVDDVYGGSALPTEIASMSGKESTGSSYISYGSTITWTDEDGNPVTEAETGKTYYGHIAMSMRVSARGNDCYIAPAANAKIAVNGQEISSADYGADPSNSQLLDISFAVVAKADESYAETLSDFDEVELVNASEYQENLPNIVHYKLKSGDIKTATISWQTDASYSDITSGTFTVTGTFTDEQDVSHEVEQRFKLIDLDAPTASPEAGDYESAQTVKLAEGVDWSYFDGTKMYYYVLPASSDKTAADIAASDYSEYDDAAGITVDTDATLLVYAQVGNRTTTVGEYAYRVSLPHAVTVTNGIATDTDHHELEDNSARRGETVRVVADGPEDGMEFDKWVVKSGDVTLDDETQPVAFFTMPDEDVEIEATYKLKTYTVSFDYTGGTGDIQNQTVQHGKTVTEPATAPTLEDATFEGWTTSDGEAYDFSTPVTDDITLYASWSKSDEPVVAYVVSFDSAGGTNVADQIVAEGGCAKKPEDPVLPGFSFVKWITEDGGDYDFATPVTGTFTLYAVWEANGDPTMAYQVTFDTCGGSEVEAQFIGAGGYAKRPATDPTREGYTFAGWYADAECTTEFDFENTAIEGETTVFAKWIENEAAPDDETKPETLPKSGDAAWVILPVAALGIIAAAVGVVLTKRRIC